MIPVKSQKELHKLCTGMTCQECMKNFRELYKICRPKASANCNYGFNDLFSDIIIHNRKEKLAKLLS